MIQPSIEKSLAYTQIIFRQLKGLPTLGATDTAHECRRHTERLTLICDPSQIEGRATDTVLK